MTPDVGELLCPTAIIHAECFQTAVAGDFVEAGFREYEQCASLGFLQPKFDQGWCFLRVISFSIDGIRMPREGKESFRFHFLHNRFPFEVLVARIGNLSTRDLTWYEWAIQLHTKPFAKLTVIRECAPDARNRRLEFNTLLNTVIHVRQPLGCILAENYKKAQPRGCYCLGFSGSCVGNFAED